MNLTPDKETQQTHKSISTEEEFHKIEKYSKYNIPIDIIANSIERSETFLREKLQDEGNNPWKEAYYRGRLATPMLSDILLEKSWR